MHSIMIGQVQRADSKRRHGIVDCSYPTRPRRAAPVVGLKSPLGGRSGFSSSTAVRNSASASAGLLVPIEHTAEVVVAWLPGGSGIG